MRKILSIILLLAFLSTPAFGELEFFWRYGLTGGGTGALDSLDVTNDDLDDGEQAIAVVSNVVYIYTYNATSGVAESSPEVIAPDLDGGAAYAGNGRWELNASYVKSLSIAENDGSVTAATMGFSSDDLKIDNNDADGEIIIAAERTGTGESNIIVADPDADVGIYYNNSLSMATAATGAGVYDTSGSDPTLSLYQDDGSTRNGYITQASDGTFKIYDDINSQNQIVFHGGSSVDIYDSGLKTIETSTDAFYLWGNTAGDYTRFGVTGVGTFQLENRNAGASVVLYGRNTADTASNAVLNGDPDGAVSLYYAGTVILSTTSAGVTLEDGTVTGTRLYHNNDDFFIRNQDPDGTVVVQSRNAADSAYSTLMQGDPDGSTDLYYNNSKVLETLSTGFRGYNGAKSAQFQVDSGGDTYVYNENNSGLVWLYSKDSGGSGTTMLKADPDGAVDIYSDGNKILSTYSGANGGIEINNEANTHLTREYFSADTFLFEVNGGGASATTLKFNVDNAAGALETAAQFIGDGSVELYNDGTKAFDTYAGGIDVYDTSGDDAVIAFYADNTTSLGGTVRFNNITTTPFFEVMEGAGSEAMIRAYNNGAVELYYDNSKTFSTIGTSDGGFRLEEPSTAKGTDFYHDGSGNMVVVNRNHGGTITIQAENTAAGNAKDIFIGDPDGAAEIYHAGTKTLETETTGIQIIGDLYPEADGTRDLGVQTTAQWANVWSDLINGADYSFLNGWRVLESDKYEGYPEGIAIGNEGFVDGKVDPKMPKGMKPLFAITEDFIEYKGIRFTAEQLKKLSTMLN